MNYDTFTGVSHISYPGYMENLSENFSMYLDWAFLQAGGYESVRIGQTRYGQDPTILRRVNSNTYESYRRGWVWEGPGIQISGVYIDNVFYTPAQTGYSINYRDGQILFSGSIPSNAVVKCEYSYKLYSTYQFYKDKWFDDILTGDWSTTYGDFNQVGSGAFSVLAQNRVNVPFVGVEVVPRRDFKGLQLGGGQIVYQDIQFWIASTEPWHVQTASDALSFQSSKTFHLFNTKFIQDYRAWPYNYNGTINPSGGNYKQLVDRYFWKKCRSVKTGMDQISRAPLYINTVRMTLEADFEDI